jgi:anti-sigma regulatory factor (Ser/Thr protein kinase)
MGPLTQTLVVPVADPSHVAVARRAATELAHSIGLDEQRISAVSVVAVELANNLVQHAGSGSMYLRYLARTGAFDIAAVDQGRGMPSVERCLEDGYSTASTPGLGLGAIRRFAVRFAAYSIPGRSTVVAARMAESAVEPDVSVICTAMNGEQVSGDSWAISEDGNTILVIDGLGHGVLAGDAARAGVEIFRRNKNYAPTALLEAMHAGMRATRGAAAAIVRIHKEKGTIDYAGIGNIAAMIVSSGSTQSLVSHNGTLGHQVRKVQQFSYKYQAGDVLLMQSDGLTTHSKTVLPALFYRQPSFLIAPFLYSEQVRGRDDATLLVNRLA